MPRLSEVTKRSHATTILTSLAKHFKRSDKTSISGKRRSFGDIAAVFEKHLAAMDRVREARAALAVAIASERAAGDEARDLRDRLLRTLDTLFGPQSPVPREFGYTPPKKPGPKTAEAKARGAEKLRATRKARGTMGARQRLKIKGRIR